MAGRNGGPKWRRAEMAGRNGGGPKWRRAEMAAGRNGGGPKRRRAEVAKKINDFNQDKTTKMWDGRRKKGEGRRKKAQTSFLKSASMIEADQKLHFRFSL